jgi:hypothetical protein
MNEWKNDWNFVLRLLQRKREEEALVPGGSGNKNKNV